MKKKKITIKKITEEQTNISLDDCYALFQKNNYNQAFKHLSKLANDDNPYSCYMMYKCLFNGLGTDKDLSEAQNWLKKAIKGNDCNAEYDYAVLFAPYHKLGQFDYNEFFHWMNLSANHGNDKAKLEIAKLYFSGKGTDRNIEKAIEIIKELSTSNPEYNFNEEVGQCYYTSSMFSEAFPYIKNAFNEKRYLISGILATYYMRGIEGVDQNVELAYQILKKGAEHHDALSEYILGSHYKDEHNIKLAIRYYKASYEHNLLEAAFELANIMMKNPLRTTSEEKQAVRLLLKASTLPVANHFDAMADLGSCYFNGYGIEYSGEKAYECFTTVLENNPEHKVALFGLANCYLAGNGVKKDSKKGIEILTHAAEVGVLPAQIDLASIYMNGKIVEQDYNKYLHWMDQAVQNGSDLAACQLAIEYEDGLKTTKDLTKAFTYYQKAAKLGNISALKKLCEFYQKGIGTEVDEVKCLFYNMVLINLFGEAHQVTGAFSDNIISQYIDNAQNSAKMYSEAEVEVAEIINNRYEADLPMFCESCPLMKSLLTVGIPDDLEHLHPAVSV